MKNDAVNLNSIARSNDVVSILKGIVYLAERVKLLGGKISSAQIEQVDGMARLALALEAPADEIPTEIEFLEVRIRPAFEGSDQRYVDVYDSRGYWTETHGPFESSSRASEAARILRRSNRRP